MNRGASLWPALLVAAVLLVGCGSSTLTDTQLRSRAARICRLAEARSDQIVTPTLPSQESRFLGRGIAALAPELASLQRLRAPTHLAGDYRNALRSTRAELAALRSTLKGLRTGNDPVVAIKTLQQQLDPAEAGASRAWTTLELPACQGA